MAYLLSRFVNAQKTSYRRALSEIKNGGKESHWIWYIFPQIKGLGHSERSEYYGIENLDEAKAYLEHPVLGERLIEICNALLLLDSNNPREVMGWPDDLKLKSSMTLFNAATDSLDVFQKVLDKYFNGEEDKLTLQILGLKN